VLNNPGTLVDPWGLCEDTQGNDVPCNPGDPNNMIYGQFEPTGGGTSDSGDTLSQILDLLWGGSWGDSFGQVVGSGISPNTPPVSQPQTQTPQSQGFTLGIRAPGQAYGACMAANANTYSLGGSLELGINVATGTDTNFSQYTGFITGNLVNGFFFGPTADAAGAMAASAPGLASSAMGSVTTYGRRTSDILSLNLEGAGGLPTALSSASAGVKSALGSIGDVLSLGLSPAERISIDAAFTGAEAVNCAIPQ
jgi:hypothetical protein